MSKLPKCREQASPHDARAFVQLGDRRAYLGIHGTPESQELYRRTVAEWLEGGCQDLLTGEVLRVSELAFKFRTFAEGIDRKPDGTKTSSPDSCRTALRPLKRLRGSMFASDFGPLSLKSGPAGCAYSQ